MSKDLILFGPPGAGKGTQGALLADRHGMVRLSTGDVLRDAVRSGTPLGSEAQRYMDAGELVPDRVILGLARDWIEREARDRGVIFDGFPRTLPQAQALDALLAELGRPLGGVIVLEVADAELVKRLSGRRACADCGAIHNVHFDPPRRDGACDSCAGPLVQRADDEPATVRRRLEVYHQQTAPLIDYYAARTAPVHHVDGARDVAAVQTTLTELLDA